MDIIDSDSKRCQGPCYSFYVDGVGCSYIDHCITSKQLTPHITSCEILPEELHNTSDHLPVAICINMTSIPKREYITNNDHIAWDKLSDDIISTKYTNVLDMLMTECLSRYANCQCEIEIDDFLKNINNCFYIRQPRV
jgi:hypothetical protein